MGRDDPKGGCVWEPDSSFSYYSGGMFLPALPLIIFSSPSCSLTHLFMCMYFSARPRNENVALRRGLSSWNLRGRRRLCRQLFTCWCLKFCVELHSRIKNVRCSWSETFELRLLCDTNCSQGSRVNVRIWQDAYFFIFRGLFSQDAIRYRALWGGN